MIMFEKYEDHDVDSDPIIVLPCRHFFTMSTLDGHIGINRVYERKGETFLGCLPLAQTDVNETSKQCPDCRSPIHFVHRYSRITKLSALRSLERKHLMAVEEALSGFSKQDPRKRNISGLLKTKQAIMSGPMKQVFEACGSSAPPLETPPPPPAGPHIKCLHLLGQTYAAKVKDHSDPVSTKSLEYFEEAILIADASQSRLSGATVRIGMARALGHWIGNLPNLKSKIMEHLKWVQNMEVGFADELVKEAKDLEESLSGKEIREVVKAMNVIRGYDYGGSSSSHWYQCCNGHPYFIGECGQAMERSRCIECGAEVGGQSHTLVTENRQWDGFRQAMGDNNT